MSYLGRTLLSAGAVLVVGAGAAVFAYLGPFKKEVEARRQQVADTYLFRFMPGEVSGGTLWVKGQEISFARGGRAWKITSPVEAEGDTRNIERTIEAVLSVRSDTKLTEEAHSSAETLKKYGLADPELRIRLTLQGGKHSELLVGLQNSFDQRYYVKDAASPTVGMADGSFLRELNQDVYKLREKRLFFFAVKDIQSLETRRGGELLLALEREGEAWRMTAPEKRVADSFESVRLVDLLRELRAEAFLDDSGGTDPALLARYGLDAPRFVVKLGTAGGNELVLRVGSARDDIGRMRWYARVDGERPLVEIGSTFYKTLEQSAVEYYDRTVLVFLPDAVRAISVKGGAEPFSLERRGEEWHLTAPRVGRARPGSVSSFLYALSHLRAKRFDTLQPRTGDRERTGLTAPEQTVSLGDGKRELGALLLGKGVPTGAPERYVGTRGGARIDVVDEAQLRWPALTEMLEPEPDAGTR